MLVKLQRIIAMIFVCPIAEYLIRTGKFDVHWFYKIYRYVRETMKHHCIGMDYEDMRSEVQEVSKTFKKYPHLKEWAINIVELTWRFYNT